MGTIVYLTCVAVASLTILVRPAVAQGVNTTLPLTYPAQVLQGVDNQTCPSEDQREIARNRIKTAAQRLLRESIVPELQVFFLWRVIWLETCNGDPLWDGQGCGSNSSCCTFNSPPWFNAQLSPPTNDDIEVSRWWWSNWKWRYSNTAHRTLCKMSWTWLNLSILSPFYLCNIWL